MQQFESASKEATQAAQTPEAHRRDSPLPKIGFVFTYIAGAWFWLAVVGMFFTDRYPTLDPLIKGTFRIYLGALTTGIIGVTVIGPGVYMAKEFIDYFVDPRHSQLERTMTRAWCIGSGVLFSAVLGAAVALIVFGPIAEIKVWFLGVCWAVLMVPWFIIGAVGRRLLRALTSRSGPREL
ncbi:MAG TPA: hypothetical protein VME43_10355 [Bryobacteraceae bacterium]|nr:hypothetical protein [Bryobacteraceae bacterium]